MRIPPVKRIPSLIPLSREHHAALVLAARIQRADDRVTRAELMARIQTGHVAELLVHFDREERLFIPVLQDRQPERVQRLLAEHARLRWLLQQIDASDASVLEEFGLLLHAHVRFEERELFPAYEAAAG